MTRFKNSPHQAKLRARGNHGAIHGPGPSARRRGSERGFGSKRVPHSRVCSPWLHVSSLARRNETVANSETGATLFFIFIRMRRLAAGQNSRKRPKGPKRSISPHSRHFYISSLDNCWRGLFPMLGGDAPLRLWAGREGKGLALAACSYKRSCWGSAGLVEESNRRAWSED